MQWCSKGVDNSLFHRSCPSHLQDISNCLLHSDECCCLFSVSFISYPWWYLVGDFFQHQMHKWTRKCGREKSATMKGLKCKIFWSLTAFSSGLLRINVNDLHTVHTHELINWVRKVTSTVAQLQSSSNRALTKKLQPCLLTLKQSNFSL